MLYEQKYIGCLGCFIKRFFFRLKYTVHFVLNAELKYNEYNIMILNLVYGLNELSYDRKFLTQVQTISRYSDIILNINSTQKKTLENFMNSLKEVSSRLQRKITLNENIILNSKLMIMVAVQELWTNILPVITSWAALNSTKNGSSVDVTLDINTIFASLLNYRVLLSSLGKFSLTLDFLTYFLVY
jgi:hypothetical protein